MYLIGVDYSISCPAVCVYNGVTKPKPSDCQFFYLTKTKKWIGEWGNVSGQEYPQWEHPMERYTLIADWAIDAMRKGRQDWMDIPKVAIEDYGFNANGRITDLAEHTGVLKKKLWDMDVPYTSVSVGSVKKSLTGKGNSTKEDIGFLYKAEMPTVLPAGISPTADCLDAYGVMLSAFF